MASLRGKVKVGDIVVFNGLDNAAQFVVIEITGPFEVKIQEVDTDYEYQYIDVDLIHSIVKEGAQQ